jgi:hypothetical protein
MKDGSFSNRYGEAAGLFSFTVFKAEKNQEFTAREDP